MLQLLEGSTGWWVALSGFLAVALARTVSQDAALRADLRPALAALAGALIASTAALFGAGAGGAGSGATSAGAGAPIAPWALYLRVASYVLFAAGLIRSLSSLTLWAARARMGLTIPKIVRDGVDVAVFLLACAAILRATLRLELGALLTTSAILSVVLGLALQETLGNLFAGLALQIDRPFQVGDWVKLGDHLGRVVQVGWRAARLRTQRHEEVTVPNAVIGKAALVNFSRGGAGVGRELLIEVDYAAAPNEVCRACEQAMREHPAVRAEPPPAARVRGWESSGIQYQLRFFADDYAAADAAAGELLAQLWYRLRRARLAVAYPTRVVHLEPALGPASQQVPLAELQSLLASAEFLRPLGPEGLAQLAERARLELYGAGEVVIREGSVAHGFFLVDAGEVVVRSEAAGEVARLRRGDYFGEMSLLTGEPRAASVVVSEDARLIALDRAAFAAVLAGNEATLKALCDALARRGAELKAKAAGAERGAHSAAAAGESGHLLGRLRAILGL